MPFSPSTNEVGNVHQFAEQYILGDPQHDPSLDFGSGAAFFGIAPEDYCLGRGDTGANILDQFVQRQGNPFFPSWSPYSGIAFQQNLDISNIDHLYPIDDAARPTRLRRARMSLCRAVAIVFHAIPAMELSIV